MKSMGMKHFRLSISWSRVLPLGTTDTVNKQGVDFYHNVIDELLLNGLEPWVTLYHWDLPSTLFNKSSTGAWLSRDIIDPFVAYADFCFNEYGSKVRKWITFNEPQTFAWIGYGIGVHAPGRCSDYMGLPCRESGGGGDTPTEPYIVSHNVILAHAKTYRLYEKKYRDTQHGELGLCVASYAYEPWDAESIYDKQAVDIKIQWEYAYYYDPLVFGQYPDKMRELITDNRLPEFTPEEKTLITGTFDYLGVNHYATKFARWTGGAWPGRDYGTDSRVDVQDYNK